MSQQEEATAYVAAEEGKAVASRAPQMVQVVAPSTLPEGYQFEAQMGEKRFMATVPKGGVKEGETFLTTVPQGENLGETLQIPTGQWKDGLFDCCRYGAFSPHLWCATFCTNVAMGQVMQRMNLTWLGTTGSPERTRDTYKVILTLTIAYFCFRMLVTAMTPTQTNAYYAAPAPSWLTTINDIAGLLMSLWSIYALMKTRKYIRTKYSIPEERCQGCEDLCCSMWCSCCTVAQLARHTGEFEQYPSNCCSETGLPANAPRVV